MERLTKIVATLGPAVANPDSIRALVAAGMDVARLNFSHGTHEAHLQLFNWVREASDDVGRPVAILQDISGPGVRVGTFPGGSVYVPEGAEVTLTPGTREGSDTHIYVENLETAELTAGSPIVMADGLITMKTAFASGGSAKAVVVQGGELKDHKSVAFPGVHVGLPPVTDKDRVDIEFGQEIGVDMLAASFVASGDSMRQIKRLVPGVPVIAKIESALGYQNLDEILEEAYGTMVARGDLGVELRFEMVPRAQKTILSRTNAKARVSITATEMLESMTHSPRPTRAEVTDVSSAVLDGTDAVMLSAETAVGEYPIRAVEAMDRICREAEASPEYGRGPEIEFLEDEARFASATAAACVDAANNLGLEAICAFTESGSTARLLSKYRPKADIYAFTAVDATYRRMAIYAGVTPMHFGRVDSTDDMIMGAEKVLLGEGIVMEGQGVVMAAGIPPNQAASTNLMKLHYVGSSARGVPGSR
jgi:pyruvate kinase